MFLGGFGVVTLRFGLVLAPIKIEVCLNLLRAGDPMPGFTLTDLRSKPVKFLGLEGHAVVLSLWATWYPPCRREMPLLDDVQQA